MRVLSFSYCYPRPSRPAWGVFIHQRLAAMARHAELQVVSPVPVFPVLRSAPSNLPLKEELDGLTIHRPRFRYLPAVLKHRDGRLYAKGIVNSVRDIVRNFRPDILDAHFIWPDGVGVANLAGSFDLPLAITLRGKLYPAIEDPRIKQQCVTALRKASVVLSVSRPMAEVAEHLGTGRGKLTVIENGVDLQRFAPRDQSLAAGELNLPNDLPILLAVGHLKPSKGQEDLLEAASGLPMPVRLVFVGGEAQRGYTAHLRKRAAGLGMEGRVHLVGRQPYGRIPTFLAAANIVVLPSWREGCPNIVLEALASGRPVVATRVGATPQLIQPPLNGHIVPPNQIAALRDGLHEALRKDWNALAIRNSPAVRSWDGVAERVLSTFAEALGSPEGDSHKLPDRPAMSERSR